MPFFKLIGPRSFVYKSPKSGKIYNIRIGDVFFFYQDDYEYFSSQMSLFAEVDSDGRDVKPRKVATFKAGHPPISYSVRKPVMGQNYDNRIFDIKDIDRLRHVLSPDTIDYIKSLVKQRDEMVESGLTPNIENQSVKTIVVDREPPKKKKLSTKKKDEQKISEEQKPVSVEEKPKKVSAKALSSSEVDSFEKEKSIDSGESNHVLSENASLKDDDKGVKKKRRKRRKSKSLDKEQ